MEKAKKRTESSAVKAAEIASQEASASLDEKRRPIKTLREGDVSASIWMRTVQYRGKPMEFYSVSFERSYKDANGAWRYSKSFDADNLGRLVAVVNAAAEEIQGLQHLTPAVAED